MRIIGFIVLALYSLMSPYAAALLPQPASVSPETINFNPLENVAFIKEAQSPLSIDFVLNNLDTLNWQQADISNPIGRTSDIYWFVINLHNTDQRPAYTAVRFTQFRAYAFDAWLVRDGVLEENFRGGLSVRLDNNNFAKLNSIHTTLEKGHHYQILYRVDAREYLYVLHFIMETASQLEETRYSFYLQIGVFCGIMLFIALCNLLAFFVFKDFLYLVTCTWIFTMTSYLMSYYAAGLRYWLVDMPLFNSEIIFLNYHISEILGVLFPILFLNTKSNSPKLHKLLLLAVAGLVVMYLFIYDQPLSTAIAATELATLLLLPFLFAVSITAWRNKQAYALYYALALSILSLYFITVILTGIFYPDKISSVISLLLYVILFQMIFISCAQIARMNALSIEAKNATLTSMTDELTGIANRRAFDTQLNQAIAHCKENDSPLSFLMMDIDFFKNYNDALGHVAGDECLVSIATAIANSLNRQQDTAARYGGEEFAVVLPGADTQAACRVASAIIDAIHALDIPHPDSSISSSVTLSIGIVTTFVNENTQAKKLVEAADQQLYLAKKSGKDRYCQRSEPTSS